MVEYTEQPSAATKNACQKNKMLQLCSKKAGDDAGLAMLVLYNDTQREYADGPAQKLPDTVGSLTQAPYDKAEKQGWTVDSIKNNRNRIFASKY